MLVTWDYDGVVYTIVTDADHRRVARAVAELPAGQRRSTVRSTASVTGSTG